MQPETRFFLMGFLVLGALVCLAVYAAVNG